MPQYKIINLDGAINCKKMTFSTHLLNEIEEQKLNDLEKKRQKILKRCITGLKEYFMPLHVKSLYITGSLVVPFKFRSQSDIDIAVEGLPAEVYFRAIFELGELLSRNVEIIELENCSFAENIRANGLKII